MGLPGRPLEEVEAMRNRGVLKIVGLAAVGLLWLFGLIGGGLSGGLMLLGLSALLLGFAAAGRADWAVIVSRRIGGAVAAAGVVALVGGCATLPPTATTFSSSTSSASTSSSSAAPTSSSSATSTAATSTAATPTAGTPTGATTTAAPRPAPP